MERPSTTFYHAKEDGSGSAVRFSLFPATRAAEGHVKVEIAPQNKPGPAGGFPTFDWNDTVVTRLYKIGLSDVLRVLRGIVDAAEIVHVKEIHFRKLNTAAPEYELSVVHAKDETRRSVMFSFTEGEAFALSVTLEQALFHVCFGKVK